MRFLADMGISPRSVGHLRARGHDVFDLRDHGLGRLSDTEILTRTRLEARIVLTHDLDFGDLLAASGDALPSVVLFRLPDMRPQTPNRYLDAVLTSHGADLERGCLLSVGERRVRVRTLPV